MADYLGIARRLRVTSESIRYLNEGRADIEMARAIGVSTDTLQQFLDGRPDVNMARRIGISSTDLRTLCRGLGREGSVAFVLGLALGAKGGG